MQGSVRSREPAQVSAAPVLQALSSTACPKKPRQASRLAGQRRARERKPSARSRRQSRRAVVERSERKHTINDIARLANVSKKTVSRVINESPFVREETRARITRDHQAASASRPTRRRAALAFRRSFLIGLIYDNPNAPYVINIQEGALGALRRVGLRARRASVRPPQRGFPDRHPPLRRAPEARRRGDAAAGLGESDARGDAAQAGMPVHPRALRGARRSEEPGHVDGPPVRRRSRRAPREARPPAHRDDHGPAHVSLGASSASKASRTRSRIAACRCRRSTSPKARTRSSRAPPAPKCCCRARRGPRRSSRATTKRRPASIARRTCAA